MYHRIKQLLKFNAFRRMDPQLLVVKQSVCLPILRKNAAKATTEKIVIRVLVIAFVEMVWS